MFILTCLCWLRCSAIALALTILIVFLRVFVLVWGGARIIVAPTYTASTIVFIAINLRRALLVISATCVLTAPYNRRRTTNLLFSLPTKALAWLLFFMMILT